MEGRIHRLLQPEINSILRVWVRRLDTSEAKGVEYVYIQVIMTKRASIDLETCAEVSQVCTNFNLRKASRAVQEIYDRAMKPIGLRGTQFSLINALALHKTAAISRLAKTLAIDPTTLTRGLAPLERDGLIESLTSEDGRERVLHLTELGYERLAQAHKRWEKAQAHVVTRLGAKRWGGLIADLKATTALLREPD